MCTFSCIQVSVFIYRYEVKQFLKTTLFSHHPVHSFRLLLTPPEMHCDSAVPFPVHDTDKSMLHSCAFLFLL